MIDFFPIRNKNINIHVFKTKMLGMHWFKIANSTQNNISAYKTEDMNVIITIFIINIFVFIIIIIIIITIIVLTSVFFMQNRFVDSYEFLYTTNTSQFILHF